LTPVIRGFFIYDRIKVPLQQIYAMETFQLEGHEFIHLNQLLKLTGIADSGGDANQLILDGEVLVNQQTATEKRKKIRVGDQVQIGDITVVVEL